MTNKPTLTVKALIDLLAAMPQELTVTLEGCDCANRAVGVQLIPASRLRPVDWVYIVCDVYEQSEEDHS